jgi:hypothetical protein
VTGQAFTAFMIGFVLGAVVFWQLSKVSERFRRARRDFREARKGLRTLAEMVLSRACRRSRCGRSRRRSLRWQSRRGSAAGPDSDTTKEGPPRWEGPL